MNRAQAVRWYNERGPQRQDLLETAAEGREKQFAALRVQLLPALYLAIDSWAACLTGDLRTVALKEQCLEELYGLMDDDQRQAVEQIVADSDTLVARLMGEEQ